jgi:hypothetical protein
MVEVRVCTSRCVHSPTGDETAFDQFMRIATHDLAILACSRFSLVGIDDEVSRTRVFLEAGLVHE